MINQIKEFLSPYLDLDSCTKAKMVFKNGTSVTTSDSLKLIQHMNSIEAIPAEQVMLLIKPENKSIGKVIVERLKAEVTQERLNELRSGSSLDDEELAPLDITTLSVYADIAKKREIEFLVDPRDSRIVSGFSYAAWKRVVGNDVDTSASVARIEYNPTNLKSYRRLQEDEDRVLKGTPVFNRYYAPDWKLRRERGDEGRLHPIMEEFFDNFIPDLACREYVFERMMMIVDKRLPVILVMNTLTGTGKGLFVESILRGGVGRDNWTAAPKSWDKSGFNSWMDSKQIVWFDEEKVMPDGENANTNYLKRLANDHQAIEKKGQDVTGATRVHTSIIVTNNQGTKNFRLEEDNRRFSVADVGLEKMSVIYGEERANEIGDAIANNLDDMIGDFWLWLSANYSTEKYGNPFTLWKGTAYKMFLYESRSLWQKVIIDICKSGEHTTVLKSELKKEFGDRKGEGDRMKFPYHANAIENFLKEFTDEGQRLGTLKKSKDTSDRDWTIEINPHWVSAETKKEIELGLREVAPKYQEPENDTASRIAQLEDDFDIDLGDL